MAYTFFKALGLPTGKSLVEDDKLDKARAILAHAKARASSSPCPPITSSPTASTPPRPPPC